MTINSAGTETGETESSGARAEIMGHPRGLAYIIFTEAWERFSYYGMQALLVLYMVRYLYLPGNLEKVIGFDLFRTTVEAVFGPLSNTALATQTAGLYMGFVYFMPLIGGFLGDRYLGRTRAVTLGALFMAAGHFLMAFENAFLFALLALVIGSGLLKGNLAAQVGDLYDRDDQRRDTAYSVYNVAINVGYMLAPLVCGTLGEVLGWHYGFGAAGIGMLVSIVIYLSGRKYLPVDKILDKNHVRPALEQGEGKIIGAILMVLIIASFYWTVQSQVWITYLLWIPERVDHEIFGWTMPVTWFLSVDSVAVLLFAPIVMWQWRRMASRGCEPNPLMKVVRGCVAFAVAFLLLVVGEILAAEGRVNMLWPILFHLVCGWGFMHLGPIIMALISRAAPTTINATMVSTYYLSLFIGGTAAGWLGKFYEQMSPVMFWVMHAVIVLFGAGLVLVFYKLFSSILLQEDANGSEAETELMTARESEAE
ncbi:peptide MFS transporter [Emcibacter sp.]|uniref:peptide MFS transporter n=1 Tax=Emcibacter sp. TaxID=1979954 RepID=UPI003A959295